MNKIVKPFVYAAGICILGVMVVVLVQLFMAFIFYNEFNPNLINYLDKCSSDWGGHDCYPPLDTFKLLFTWNPLTRIIMSISIAWGVVSNLINKE